MYTRGFADSIHRVEGSFAALEHSKRELNAAKLGLCEAQYPIITKEMISLFNRCVGCQERVEEKEIDIARNIYELNAIQEKIKSQKGHKVKQIALKIFSLLLSAAVISSVAAGIFLLISGVPAGAGLFGLAGLLNIFGEMFLMMKLHQAFNPLAPLRGSFLYCYHMFASKTSLKIPNKEPFENNIAECLPRLQQMCSNLQARKIILQTNCELTIQLMRGDVYLAGRAQ